MTSILRSRAYRCLDVAFARQEIAVPAQETLTEQERLTARILRLPIEIVVTIWLILDGIAAPLFRPVMRFLSSLRIVRRLEKAIASLPPYAILILLVVPFAFAELAKLYAVIIMAEGRVPLGGAIFVGAYVVSILGCERILHAGKDKLMRINWFKVAFDWVVTIKTKILSWARSTRFWRRAAVLGQRARGRLRQTRLWLQAAFGFRPKRYLGRGS